MSRGPPDSSSPVWQRDGLGPYAVWEALLGSLSWVLIVSEHCKGAGGWGPGTWPRGEDDNRGVGVPHQRA